LEKIGLLAFQDRVAALPARYEALKLEAARLLEPEIQEVALPKRMLKDENDIEAWLQEVRRLLLEKIKSGPLLP
jgi:hypothetical protein